MKRIIFFGIIYFLFNYKNIILTQNLVINPSFENFTSCPQGPSQLNLANNWYDPFQNLNGDTCSTSDLYNACNLLGSLGVDVPANVMGNEPAHTGNGYAGIILYEAMPVNLMQCSPILTESGWREYVEGELSQPLTAGQDYCISFWVSLADDVKWASNNFGVYLSATQVMVNCASVPNGNSSALSLYGYTPQLTYSGSPITTVNGWQLIQFNYTAAGGEQYIVIGNFYDDNNTTTQCVNASATNPYSYYYIDDVSVTAGICCDATINPAGPFCTTDPATNLTAIMSGGTWSGTGITNATNGTFDPSVAGAGTHTITYSLPCGDTQTIQITVNVCNFLTACEESNGDITVTSGVGPYTWFEWQTTTINPSNQTECTQCGGTWLFGVCSVPSCSVTGWANTGSGTTYTPSSFPVKVVDSNGDSLVINSAGSLPPCSTTTPCDSTINPAGPFCTSDAAVNLTAVTPGGTWSGTGITDVTNGTFDPSVAGAGTHTISYTPPCGSTGTIDIIVNQTANATITGAPYGPYCSNNPDITLTATDPGGTWSGTGITDATNGIFSPATAGVGSHQIIYTISGTCGDADTITIQVTAGDTAAFNYTSTTFCTTDANPLPTITGTQGGTFTMNNGGIINSSTGEIDIAASGTGTFTVYYTTNGSCPATDSVIITITNCIYPIAGFTASDTLICQGSCIDFFDNSNGSPTSWVWTFDQGNPNTSTDQNPTNICYDSAGVFTVKLVVSNANGSDSTTSSIYVSPLPVVNAGNDTTINGGQSVTLNATGTGTSYSWTPLSGLSCSTCPNPTVTPDETTTYTVITTDSVGCIASDQITVYVDYEYVIYIPNIFSPNGDGRNDILYVRGKGVKTLYFAIYDRWGEKVFETTDLNTGWDGTYKGKPLNKAVFVYYVKATFVDNTEIEQKGDITLIR